MVNQFPSCSEGWTTLHTFMIFILQMNCFHVAVQLWLKGKWFSTFITNMIFNLQMNSLIVVSQLSPLRETRSTLITLIILDFMMSWSYMSIQVCFLSVWVSALITSVIVRVEMGSLFMFLYFSIRWFTGNMVTLGFSIFLHNFRFIKVRGDLLRVYFFGMNKNTLKSVFF